MSAVSDLAAGMGVGEEFAEAQIGQALDSMPPIVCGANCMRISHTGRYPPGLSGYTHGNCRCCYCTAANTLARRRQRAGQIGRPHLRLEDRVRREMSP